MRRLAALPLLVLALTACTPAAVPPSATPTVAPPTSAPSVAVTPVAPASEAPSSAPSASTIAVDPALVSAFTTLEANAQMAEKANLDALAAATKPADFVAPGTALLASEKALFLAERALAKTAPADIAPAITALSDVRRDRYAIFNEVLNAPEYIVQGWASYLQVSPHVQDALTKVSSLLGL